MADYHTRTSLIMMMQSLLCMSRVLTTYLFILSFLSSSQTFAQRNITGTVIDDFKEGLIGVSISNYLNNNGTRTDINGNFKIEVPDSIEILRFRYIGYEYFDLALTQDSIYEVILKETCTKCWFDAQEINIGLSVDLISKLSGGFIEITSPGIFGSEVFKLRGDFLQSNRKNRNNRLSAEISHLFSTCDFDMDLSINYMYLNFNDQRIRTYGVYSNLNFNKFNPAVGLVLKEQFYELIEYELGVSIGYNLRVSRPFNLSILVLSTIWRNDLEFKLGIERYIKNNFSANLRGYKFNSARIISLGVKYEFGYFLKGQNYRFLHD